MPAVFPKHHEQCLDTTFSDNLLSSIPDLIQEDVDAIVSEQIVDDTVLINEYVQGTESEETVASVKAKVHLEIELPLTPKMTPSTFEEVTSRWNNIDQDPVLHPDYEPLLAMTSSPVDLRSVFGSDTFETEYYPGQHEQLELFDTTMRIPEPRVTSITSKPDLGWFPSTVLDLVCHGSDSTYKHIVETVPSRHLNINVRWAPFIGNIQPVDTNENLLGSEMVSDFVNVDDPAAEEVSFIILAERSPSPQAPTSTLCPIVQCSGTYDEEESSAFKPPRQAIFAITELSSVTLEADEAIQATTSTRGTSESIEERPAESVHFSQWSELPEQAIGGATVDELTTDSCSSPVNFDYRQHQDTWTPKVTSADGNTFWDEDVFVSPHYRIYDVSGGPELMPVVEDHATAYAESPMPEALQNLPDECSKPYKVSSDHAISSDDSLEQLLQSRKRQYVQDEDPVTIETMNCFGGLQDYLRLRSKQPPRAKLQRRGNPIATVSIIDSEQVPPENIDAITIAPNLHVLQYPNQEYFYTISTTLLNRPALWRALKRDNPSLSLIERDLDIIYEVDLVCSTLSGILFFCIEHIEHCSLDADNYLSSQIRMSHCVKKYQSLSVVITTKVTVTDNQAQSLARFQGWLAAISGKTKIILILSSTEEEQAQYLGYLAAHYTETDGAVHGHVLVDDSLHERFLRSCPYINATAAQALLSRYTLIQYLKLTCDELRLALQEIGIYEESQSTAIYETFRGSWHVLKLNSGIHEYNPLDEEVIT